MTEAPDPKSIYPDALVDEIAAAIGIDDSRRRRRLAQGLRDVAEHADSCRRTFSIAPPGARAEALDRIKAAYDQLLACLRIDPANPDPQGALQSHVALHSIMWEVAAARSPKHPEGAIEVAHERFDEHSKSLVEFRAASIQALVHTNSRISRGRGGARHKPDQALALVAYMLSGIYKDVTGREIGASIGRKEQGGPGVRFMQLSLRALGWEKSPTQLRTLIRGIKTKPPVHGG